MRGDDLSKNVRSDADLYTSCRSSHTTSTAQQSTTQLNSGRVNLSGVARDGLLRGLLMRLREVEQGFHFAVGHAEPGKHCFGFS